MLESVYCDKVRDSEWMVSRTQKSSVDKDVYEKVGLSFWSSKREKSGCEGEFPLFEDRQVETIKII